MKKGQQYLWNCINKNLKENELIYILTENELKNTYIMHTHTRNTIFNSYSDDEIVVKFWFVNDGICIIIK